MVPNFVAVLLVIALGVGAAGLALSTLERTVSSYHFQRAIALSNTEGVSMNDVQAKILSAARILPLDTYYRSLSQLNIARAQSVLNSTTGTQAENQERFQEAVSNSISAAQLAVNTSPGNYDNWTTLGSIYSSLVRAPFSVEGSYEAAKSAFEEARRLNPTSPEVPLLEARLELDRGDATEARSRIESSLALKQDYVDAYFLLTQLELQENNLREAIRSSETTAFLAPNNAGVFFQLGLLKYTNGDWAGAKSALSRALAILPNYANAKYYLGLAEEKLGNSSVAITLFEDLAETNPDNTEVKQILSNLEAGKDPLAGLASESQSVVSRPAPPIDETQ